AALTRGHPRPDEIQAEKEREHQHIDLQMQQAQVVLQEQTNKERDFLRSQASQAKEIASGRWDQHLRTQELSAEQEYQQQLAKVHEDARQMRLILEQQSSQLILEYETRRAQEDINHHMHEVELHQWE
ncbi:unnamed protein product, partial [Polarella glacialis]